MLFFYNGFIFIFVNKYKYIYGYVKLYETLEKYI